MSATYASYEATRFIAKGKYSLVYEVISHVHNQHMRRRRRRRGGGEGGGEGSGGGYLAAGEAQGACVEWILKRIFIHTPSALRRALRECNAMARVAHEAQEAQEAGARGQRKSSAFLVALHAAFVLRQSAVLIMEKTSGFDLGDLLVAFSRTIAFHEDTVRFYVCELMCALAHLHEVCHLVHMDVKPENVFLAQSGHILLGDFDGAFDLRRGDAPLTCEDFFGTSLFVAPEVACAKQISCKCDVWSLGILTAITLMGGTSSLRKCAKSSVGAGVWGEGGGGMMYVDSVSWLSEYNTRQFMSVEMGELLTVCLQEASEHRLMVEQMKHRLAFFEKVQWEQVEALALRPPFLPSALRHGGQSLQSEQSRPTDSIGGGGESRESRESDERRLLLKAAFGDEMPLFDERRRLCTRVNSLTGERRYVEQQPDKEKLRNAGLTPRRIARTLKNFEFNAPRRSTRRGQSKFILHGASLTEQ